MDVLQKLHESSLKITSFTKIKKYCERHWKLQKNIYIYIYIYIFGVYWSEKRNHSLIFKVLKSIYIFESTSRFTYEHIRIDIWF